MTVADDVKGLEDEVEDLKESLDASRNRIAELEDEVDTLNSEVESLTLGSSEGEVIVQSLRMIQTYIDSGMHSNAWHEAERLAREIDPAIRIVFSDPLPIGKAA